MNSYTGLRHGPLTVSNKTFAIVGVTGLLLLSAIYAHITTQGNPDSTGVFAVLDHIFDIALASALSVLTFCVGRALCRVLQLQFVSVAEELSFSIMLGTGALGLSILTFALLGFLKPLPVGLFILLLFLGLRSELLRLSEVIRSILISATGTRERVILSGLYLLLLGILVLRASTPPWSVDEIIYHLPATRLFVEQGRIYPLYHQPLGNMPFLIHMIYAICLLAKSDIAAKLFSLLLTIVTSIALYGFSVRFLTRSVGVVAMFGFLSAAMVVEVGVSTRIDVSLAGMLFLATYAMMLYLDTREMKWLFTSAILSGFSIGIKLNAGLWLACLVAMLLFESAVRLRIAAPRILKTIVLYSLITLALSSPWLIKNAIWFHNPVYPFVTGELADFNNGKPRYFGREDEVKLDAHFDAARKASPEQFQYIKTKFDDAVKAAGVESVRHPMRFWEYYTNPKKYFMGDYHHYPNYLFVVLPLLVLVPKKRLLTWLMLLSVAFFLVVSSTSWIARFLLPLYPALTVLSAYALVEFSKRFIKRRAKPFCFLLIAVCMAVPLGLTARLMHQFDHVGFIFGATSRSQFLSSIFYYPPIDFINRNLPENARVFSLGGEMCYHMRRRYISEGSWDGTEWRRLLVHNDSLEDLHRDLKSQGITHVLFGSWYFEFIIKTGWPKPGGSRFLATAKFTEPERILEFGPDYNSLRNWVTFDQYRREYLELMYIDANEYEVYRLK